MWDIFYAWGASCFLCLTAFLNEIQHCIFSSHPVLSTMKKNYLTSKTLLDFPRNKSMDKTCRMKNEWGMDTFLPEIFSSAFTVCFFLLKTRIDKAKDCNYKLRLFMKNGVDQGGGQSWVDSRTQCNSGAFTGLCIFKNNANKLHRCLTGLVYLLPHNSLYSGLQVQLLLSSMCCTDNISCVLRPHYLFPGRSQHAEGNT